VNLRAYGQRDPLVEYKKEGLRAFRALEATLRNELILFLENLDGFFAQQQARMQAESGFVSVIPSVEGPATASVGVTPTTKVGRNDQCPCGSGKKWKKCGELNTEEHKQLTLSKQ
jgi:preprotein translocase subunit SecA